MAGLLLGLRGTSGLGVNLRSCEAVEEGNCNLCYGVIILCRIPEFVSPNLCFTSDDKPLNHQGCQEASGRLKLFQVGSKALLASRGFQRNSRMSGGSRLG